jgi:6-phosphogluconolactonase
MADSILFFIGTYTTRLPHADGKSKGIHAYRLDLTSGAMTHASTCTGIVNPSYVTLDPQQRYLYAVTEAEGENGRRGGAVSSFRVNRDNGELTPINTQPSHGDGPCHVWVDGSGRWMLVANYNSGSAAIYPIRDDGSLGEASDTIQHEGSSVNPNRQEGPHAHCIMTDPSDHYVLIADLGIDKVMVYQLDRESGRLSAVSWAQVEVGAGPRHIKFHPSGRYCFLINELASTITVFAYDDGGLREVQTISTLPADFSGENTTAAIHVAPNGRFVYGSNRGHDSIAIFAFDEGTGQLTAAGHESTQGKTPRDFMIDPTGAFLLAANQDTDNIVSYRVDPQSGRLIPTGHMVEVPTPVCLKPVRP